MSIFIHDCFMYSPPSPPSSSFPYSYSYPHPPLSSPAPSSSLLLSHSLPSSSSSSVFWIAIDASNEISVQRWWLSFLSLGHSVMIFYCDPDRVSMPATVTKGQAVATHRGLHCGCYGTSMTDHIHYQVDYYGTRIDPASWIYCNWRLENFHHSHGTRTEEADGDWEGLSYLSWID